MSQRIFRPARDPRSTRGCREKPQPGTPGEWRHWAALPAEWREPGAQIVTDWHQSALGSLRLGGSNLDEPPVQIHGTPIQTRDFRCAQAGEGADATAGRISGEQAWSRP